MILNFTQHKATQEQRDSGVVDSYECHQEYIGRLLTFDTIPSKKELQDRATECASIIQFLGFDKVMIGGAPFFMSYLEKALRDRGITPMYAFSTRVSSEVEQPDGSIRKVNVFNHIGFVEC